MLRQFRHMFVKLGNGDRLPAVALISDSVVRQHVPTVRSYPSSDILVLRDLATVYVEPILRTLRILRTSWPTTRLLVSRTDYGFLDRRLDVVKRIAVRGNWLAQSSFNPFL